VKTVFLGPPKSGFSLWSSPRENLGKQFAHKRVPPRQLARNDIFGIALSSNSTISTFKFNQPQKQISFNVTGPSAIISYCNITIPKTLLKDNPWTIIINTLPITNYTKTENNTHVSLYFTYVHSGINQILIQGTWVVPEFPSTLLLSIAFAMLVVTLFNRKFLKN